MGPHARGCVRLRTRSRAGANCVTSCGWRVATFLRAMTTGQGVLRSEGARERSTRACRERPLRTRQSVFFDFASLSHT